MKTKNKKAEIKDEVINDVIFMFSHKPRIRLPLGWKEANDEVNQCSDSQEEHQPRAGEVQQQQVTLGAQ